MHIVNTYAFSQFDPNKSYILFVRHGQSEGNALHMVSGASPLTDLDLTEKGKKDAKNLGNSLLLFKDRVNAIYASPLKRAIETAKIALKVMGLDKTFHLDDRLKEKFYGEAIDGQSSEVYSKYGKIEKEQTKEMSFSQKWTYKLVEDAESYEEIYARIKDFMIESAKKQHFTLVFGHKVSCLKIPAMGVLAEEGIEVDYRDPPFNDPKNGASALFEVDPKNEKIRLVAIDGFSFSFMQK